MDILDKIPPYLPFPKGGIPLFGKEGRGDFPEMMSSHFWAL